ncbi:MAG TPA: hypothetical protein VE526_12870 [Solirubrobacteraceae bacterium]|nr:hypothetical protein [Solirubrobacteraceae bacterium]
MIAIAVAGCGGDDAPDGTRTMAFESNELREPGESGTSDARACQMLPERFVARVVGVTAVEAAPNDSLDLTICEWHGGAARVKLLVDSAPRAQLRYYNLLAEQHEFHNADPARKARQIKGVGEDSAYGGAGAWWTRATRQLVAYDSDKIFKLRVNVAGFADGAARKAAVRLTKRAVRELR